MYYPKPITIIELAEIVQRAIVKHSKGAIQPSIEVINTGQKPLFTEGDIKQIRVDISKAINFLGLNQLKSPEKSIDELVKKG